MRGMQLAISNPVPGGVTMLITRTRFALLSVVMTALLAASIETSWAEDSTREALKKAEARLKEVLKSWKASVAQECEPPVAELDLALGDLMKVPSPAGPKRVAALLVHRDPAVARQALAGLERCGAKQKLFVGSLIAERLDPKQFKDGRVQQFTGMVEAIGRSGYLGSFRQLRLLLQKSADLRVQMAIVKAFDSLGDPRAIQALLSLIQGGSPARAGRSNSPNPRNRTEQSGEFGCSPSQKGPLVTTSGPDDKPIGPAELRNQVYATLSRILGQAFLNVPAIQTHLREHKRETRTACAKTEKTVREQRKTIVAQSR
jgi:hypothetical protein